MTAGLLFPPRQFGQVPSGALNFLVVAHFPALCVGCCAPRAGKSPSVSQNLNLAHFPAPHGRKAHHQHAKRASIAAAGTLRPPCRPFSGAWWLLLLVPDVPPQAGQSKGQVNGSRAAALDFPPVRGRYRR